MSKTIHSEVCNELHILKRDILGITKHLDKFLEMAPEVLVEGTEDQVRLAAVYREINAAVAYCSTLYDLHLQKSNFSGPKKDAE
jgi:hypothetical protein